MHICDCQSWQRSDFWLDEYPVPAFQAEAIHTKTVISKVAYSFVF